jgi:uncharacterized protein
VTVYSADIIFKTIDFVKSKSEGESSGHDWWHIYRVRKMAVYLAKEEKADIFVIELASLLHDLDDWKFNTPDSCQAVDWMQKCALDEVTIEKVMDVITKVSYKGAGEANKADTIEAQVVQDADRLDAIGAIGIARAFAYGGYKNREIFRPGISPELHGNFDAYQKNQSHTINHFYEKLLLLKDRLNTSAARKLAEKRHQVLEDFLTEFHSEWNFNEISEDQK